MASLKAHEVDRFLSSRDLPSNLFLIYGPDSGLVRERGRNLAGRFSNKAQNPHELISLDMSELDQDQNRLAVEARTTSLFGGAPVVRVRNVQKSILGSVEALIEDWPNTPIILEAGNLTSKDKLRSKIEKFEYGTALPCYADSVEDRKRLISNSFSEAGISVSPDVLARLVDLLGNDREVTRREIEKLVLFATHSKRLELDDVEALCGDNAANNLDQLIDALAIGNVQRTEFGIMNAASQGIDHQRILISTLNHFRWLREKLAEARETGSRPLDAMNKGWPKPHFSRRSALERQARIWSDQALTRVNEKLYETILETRQNAHLADAIASRTLLSLAAMAAKR